MKISKFSRLSNKSIRAVMSNPRPSRKFWAAQ